MFASVNGMSVVGLTAQLIKVEVDISNGLPAFDIVGLPATSVKEAKDRVRSALRNSGFSFPLQRITVNLAPADLRKEGSGLDLPIAVGILVAMQEIEASSINHCVFAGELSLEGILRPIPGTLTMALELRKMIENNITKSESHDRDITMHYPILIIPPNNLGEARLIPELESESVYNLVELISILKNKHSFSVEPVCIQQKETTQQVIDWSDIHGQIQAKRALEIAAAGGHNLLMIGPPGSGKTLLARAFAGILPPLTLEESLEVTQLYSIAGFGRENGKLITSRPFRSPHHSATIAGIIGGGQKLTPGELALANHGVLFLDELPEFSREVLESLRQPLEDRKFTLIRLRGRVEFPARVCVISSMNPCPCGFYGDNGRQCTCTPLQVNNYRGRISGPLLDRFDLQIEVPRLRYDELKYGGNSEPSDDVRKRVIKAREIQTERFLHSRTNAEMTTRETKLICKLDQEGESLLKKIFDKKFFSARAHDRILRVSRTIADMEGSVEITTAHIAESLQYRTLDRDIRF